MGNLKQDAKSKLVVCISSLDSLGLSLPPLSGKTLVQFLGSLTGRDFWIIAQICPFVLYNLLPKECYNAWLALSSLVPLIWLPVIDELDTYLVTQPPLLLLYPSLMLPLTAEAYNCN